MKLNLTLRISLFFLVAAAVIGMALYQPAGQALASDQESQVSQKLDRQTRIREAEQEELIRTMDPALGYIPRERLIEAIEFTRQRQAEMVTSRGSITEAAWREQGPNNIGGRTRTIHVDLNDPTGETVWAGAVSGGLWKTTQFSDPDPQWQKFDDFFDNLAIGALAQDPNDPNVMYMGTGEIYTCLGQEGHSDLRAPLRASESDTILEEAIHAAIALKPKGHDFDYSRQKVDGQVSRHMSHTGG